MEVPFDPRPAPAGDGSIDAFGDGGYLQELANAVSTAMPDEASELWLGQLVLEVQKASDRAIAAAREHGDSIVADARMEALDIRDQGRRWSHAGARVRDVIHQAVAGRSSPPEHRSTNPVPPPPWVFPTGQGPGSPSLASLGAVGARLPTRPPSIEDWAVAETAKGELATKPTDPAWLASPGPVTPPPPGREPSGSAISLSQAPPVSSEDDSTQPATRGPEPLSPPEPTAVTAREIDTGPVRAVGHAPGANVERPGLRIAAAAIVAGIAIVVTVLGFSAFEHVGTAAQERSSQKQLVAQFALTTATPDAAAPTAPGRVMGLLAIPSLGVDQAVVEGATVGDLRRGPAHDTASPQPGGGGAVVILGHRNSYAGPFGRLGQLHAGDVVSVRTAAGLFVYRVSQTAQVLRSGSQVLQLPSVPQVNSDGAVQVGQSLVLATGVNSRASALEVVVATLDRGSAVARVGGTGSVLGARLRSVPGQRIGFLLLLFWAGLLAALSYLYLRIRPRIPVPVLAAVGSIVAICVIYQMYLSVDRLLPGTY